MNETLFKIEVRPQIPEGLAGLEELANDLLYSWDRGARGLFYRLDISLWESCNHNPKLFLRRVSQQILDDAAADHIFMEEYSRVMSAFANYHQKVHNQHVLDSLDIATDQVAYFCAEFGFHESFPIYSGGLGILAGDHCKAASDLGVPFVAMGLLYRQGYFNQSIDGDGNQMAVYHAMNFDELLVHPATDAVGNEVVVEVDLDDHPVKVKVWKVKAGHIDLYLLDTDLPDNSKEDRSITFQLYGGDKNTRIRQEIVLGIAGVRALRAIGIAPTVWHINEGHAAFQILERIREQVASGLTFYEAMEYVAANTVFTTHTPVPAGHDIFEPAHITQYFTDYAKQLGISMDEFLQLGLSNNNHGSFNMTALALRGSRFHNGVSRIHGGVASQMEGYIWPQVPYEDNPISYVTNGVHVQTFLAREWVNLFDMRFREWRNELLNKNYWTCIDTIPDHRFWSLRKELKALMLDDVCRRTTARFKRAGYSKSIIKRITQFTSKPESDVLVFGFARRFATYKRATLLFEDPARLARLVNNPDRPVMFIFAGKAHPSDIPGQELIRTIHEYSLRPEFIGKIILLEGYDMSIARKLVTGTDVWINTPEYPLEASGTSGEKAAINGVVNLSVVDGWWGEGYNGKNGWAIHPSVQHQHNHQLNSHDEAKDLLDIIEYDVIPKYFNSGSQGYSTSWVKISKESIKSCLPRFNSQRMVVDYVEKFYSKAGKQHKRFAADNYQAAKTLAAWKEKVRTHWVGVSMHRTDEIIDKMLTGETLHAEVGVNLNTLAPEDVIIEAILYKFANNKYQPYETIKLSHDGQRDGMNMFTLKLRPAQPGLSYYKIRMYPHHELLSHRFELGFMMWI